MVQGEHPCEGPFMQATGNKAELGQLRSYLISKLMWDPDADDNEIIDEFLGGYYGAAAEYMREYIDRIVLFDCWTDRFLSNFLAS